MLGLLGLAPAFVYGHDSAARIAIAVGGTLLAYRAWRRLTAAPGSWRGRRRRWERTAVLFHAAERQELPGALDAVTPEKVVVEARDLVFRYSDRTEARIA